MTNVKFAVIVPTYSTTHKRIVMGSTPVVEHVEGHFADQQVTLESEIIPGTEQDRAVRYRLIFQRTERLDDVVRSGAIILITHRRHRLTNSWKVLAAQEQYIVHSDTDVQAVGDAVNIGLIRKDQQ